MLTRTPTNLTDDDERLVAEVIGCLIAVHRALGPGLSEAAYSRASSIELHDRGISHDSEKEVAISYKGHDICHYRIDLVIRERMLVEIKAVDAIHPVHVAQAVTYLRATGYRVALVVNFNVPLLKDGIRRVVV